MNKILKEGQLELVNISYINQVINSIVITIMKI